MKKLMRIISIFLGVIVLSGCNVVKDDISLPFQDDINIMGNWKAVDFVDSSIGYNPSNPNYTKELYVKSLTFLEDGICKFNGSLKTSFSWTKDYVLNTSSKTASKYHIQYIDGVEYMFMEWKSGDYTRGNTDVQYYVFIRN